jgi:hypothetical protein
MTVMPTSVSIADDTVETADDLALDIDIADARLPARKALLRRSGSDAR